MTEDTDAAENEIELDLLAEVTAYLAHEMRCAIPPAECLRIFWARAEAVRGVAPDEQIAKAFLARMCVMFSTGRCTAAFHSDGKKQ